MTKSNVLHRKTVLLLIFLLQGLMATVTHTVGVGGCGMYQWAVELLSRDGWKASTVCGL